MVSRHIGKFVILILTASFQKQSKGELLSAFCLKKDFETYYILIFADSLNSIRESYPN